MLNKIVGFVCNVRTAVTAFVVSVFAGIPYLASAQTPVDVTLQVPEINYAGVVSQIMVSLTPLLIALVGLGISIVVFLFLYRTFRRNIG